MAGAERETATFRCIWRWGVVSVCSNGRRRHTQSNTMRQTFFEIGNSVCVRSVFLALIFRLNVFYSSSWLFAIWNMCVCAMCIEHAHRIENHLCQTPLMPIPHGPAMLRVWCVREEFIRAFQMTLWSTGEEQSTPKYANYLFPCRRDTCSRSRTPHRKHRIRCGALR